MKNRLYAFDTLRAVAMYLGVVLHAAIPYQVHGRPGWPVDHQSSILFDFIYLNLHSFRMQLFYLIAGFFAHLLLSKIGTNAFVKHRYKRIFVPFIASVILVTPLSAIPFNYYNLIISSTLPDFWSTFLLSVEQAIGWNGLYHLWFLYYLLMYYTCVLVITELSRRVKLRSLVISNAFSPKNLLFAAVIVFVISHLFFGEHIEPWTGIVPKVGQFLYYGIFFTFGYLLHIGQGLKINVKFSAVYLLLGSLLCVLLFINSSFFEFIQSLAVIKIIYSLITVTLIAGTIGLFVKYFNSENELVTYFSDSSYWFYLIHFPIVVGLQIIMLSYDISVYLKFSIVLSVTSVICVLTYHFFVRSTIIGLTLNGKIVKKSKTKY